MSVELAALIVALLSFVMSAATWGRDLWLRRNRIDLAVIDFTAYRGKCVQFYLRLHNRSTIPASVSHISVTIDGVTLECELDQKLIRITKAGHHLHSPAFPLNLPPRAFTAVYLEFLTPQDMQLAPGKTVVFEVHTSRGTIAKTIPLPPAGRYLHTR